jgi:histidyl-tRNA synthetase
MMKEFGGPDICGIGFAMGMERLLSMAEIPARKRSFLYFAYLGGEAKKKAMELSSLFRRNGIECLVEYRDKGLKAHMGRAGKLNASWVLIIGDDELAKGRYPLKNMDTGVQIEGTPEDIIAAVRDRG